MRPSFPSSTRKGEDLAVYETARRDLFDDADSLLQQHRVQSHAPADYSEGSAANMWLTRAVEQIADRMVAEHEERVGKVKKSTGHVVDFGRAAPGALAIRDPRVAVGRWQKTSLASGGR